MPGYQAYSLLICQLLTVCVGMVEKCTARLSFAGGDGSRSQGGMCGVCNTGQLAPLVPFARLVGGSMLRLDKLWVAVKRKAGS
jgi:hypothetical protein